MKEFRFRSQAGARLGLSTFALPSLHPDFPYQAFLSGCDFIMPQIYTVPSRRWAFLRELHGYATEAVDQLNRYGRPVIPTLRAYTGDGLYDWRRIVEDARAFLATPLAQSLPAFNWWVWQSAERNVDMWRLLSATAQAVVQGEE